uniref:Uncharacterized protein n=1 Tax=Seriola lalandi dorsalis TaxID=1841481 RepID=A0A3B4X338_SERLL
MEGEDGADLSPSSPLPPHITAEHSYSLCGDSRPQSPLSHLTGEQGSDSDGDSAEWPMEQEEVIEGLLCETPSLLPTLSLSLASSEGIKEENIIPQIKLEPHEVDQFLNLSPKGQNLSLPAVAHQSHEAARTPAGLSLPLLHPIVIYCIEKTPESLCRNKPTSYYIT